MLQLLKINRSLRPSVHETLAFETLYVVDVNEQGHFSQSPNIWDCYLTHGTSLPSYYSFYETTDQTQTANQHWCTLNEVEVLPFFYRPSKPHRNHVDGLGNQTWAPFSYI